jgi:hypothetical protein
MINQGLQQSVYKNKFLLNIMSAGEIPDILSLGRKKIIKPGLTTTMMNQFFGFSQYVLQKGAGRDDEVVEELVRLLPDYSMLGGGTIDDGPNLRNYQFLNKTVLKNSVVSLGFSTQLNNLVKTTHNMKKTGIEFTITKTSKDGRIIHEINRKPALQELVRLLGWPSDLLTDETWFKTNFYFPLGFYIKEKNEYGPRVIGVILGNSLITTIRSKDPEACILTIDGKGLIQAVDENMLTFPETPAFGLFASCTTRLETLGDKIYQVQNRLHEYFKEKPFIEFYVGGESTYSPQNGLNSVNISFNSAVFWDKNECSL